MMMMGIKAQFYVVLWCEKAKYLGSLICMKILLERLFMQEIQNEVIIGPKFMFF